MAIIINFECDGCRKNAPATKRPRRHFYSFNGKGFGFGSYRFDGIEDVIPENWIAFDPYTGCCYCPECWANIEGDNPADEIEGIRSDLKELTQ